MADASAAGRFPVYIAHSFSTMFGRASIPSARIAHVRLTARELHLLAWALDRDAIEAEGEGCFEQTDGESRPSASNAEVSLRLAAKSRAVATQDQPTLPLRVIGWRPIRNPAVIGAVDLVPGRSLEILGSLVLASNGKIWVAFPGEPRIGADDKVIRDAELAKRPGALRVWERKFVTDLLNFARITSKQRYILALIADRVLGKPA